MTQTRPAKAKVAAIRVVWGDRPGESPDEIITRGLLLAEEAADQGARYILLPENFLHSRQKADQTIPGPLTDRVVELAKRRGVYVAAGMIESEKSRGPERPEDWDDYLSCVLSGPEGVLSVHRKVDIVINPLAREWRQGNPKTDCSVWGGDDFAMHRMGEIERIGVMICRDARSPWAWTRVLSQDPRVIFAPNLRSSIMKYGADFPEMARRYGVPIVAADGHPESGTMIVDRDGTILELETERERALVAEITLADGHPNYVTFEVVHNFGNPG